MTYTTLKGVAAVVLNPDGHVVANCADFERQTYGGFSLEEGQTIRVRRDIKRRFAEGHLNQWLATKVSSHFADEFWRHAEGVGYQLHTFPISAPLAKVEA